MEWKAGRELDALVAEQVMGLCSGQLGYVTDDELMEKYRAEVSMEWQTEYGESPPQRYVENEARERVGCVTSGDYPPKKCMKCKDGPHRRIPDYSTSISAAWVVVEKLSDKWEMNLRTVLPGRDYVCELKLVVKDKCIVDTEHPFEHVWSNPSPTAALSICLAAIKAVCDKI